MTRRSATSSESRERHPATIRAYDPARDGDDLRTCFLALQEFERSLEPTLPSGAEIADTYLERMLARAATWEGAIFVAEIDGRVVGFVSAWGRVPQEEPDEPPADYAFVSDLVVLPEARGRGIGRALLGTAERHGRECGAATLRIGALARNAGARRLYERAGFVDYRVQMSKRLG